MPWAALQTAAGSRQTPRCCLCSPIIRAPFRVLLPVTVQWAEITGSLSHTPQSWPRVLAGTSCGLLAPGLLEGGGSTGLAFPSDLAAAACLQQTLP